MATLTYTKAAILGLAQGLAEFLPISSSGHLALLQYFFGIDSDNVLFFTVMLHLGTLLAVFFCYWKDIVDLCKELVGLIKDVCTGKGMRINSSPTRRLGAMMVVATIPTALIGVLFDDLFEGLFTTIIAVGVGLLLTGTLLFVAQRLSGGFKHEMEMNYRNAIFIGVMQGLAITPGISRSGSTLFGGLVTQLDRAFAVKFAFLISIPSILGSFVFEVGDALEAGLEGLPVGPLLLGVVIAAISGIFAIKVMIKVVTGKKLTVFSWYTWILGVFVIFYALVLG